MEFSFGQLTSIPGMFATVSRRQVSATTRINEANDSAVIKTTEIFECEGRGKLLWGRKN
jgi:hypothetical protein